MDENNAPAHAPSKQFILWLLSMVVVLSTLPMDVMLPSYPALARFFGVAVSEVTVFVAIFALGFALSQVIAGPLSDRYGRGRILIMGLGISLIGVFGCLLSEDKTTFSYFRFIQGVGCGCFVLTQALVQDVFSSEERQGIRIFLVTLGGICIAVAPLFGTCFEYLWGWKGSFYVSAVLAIVILVQTAIILRSLEGKHPVATRPPHTVIHAYGQFFGNKPFVYSWLISALAFSSHFGFIAISPLIFLEELGMTNVTYSLVLLVYGLAYLAGGLIASRFAKHLRIAAQINIGLTFSAVSGLIMLGSVFNGVNILSILLPMIICTLGTTMVRPASVSRAMNIFEDNAGTASAAGGTLMFVTAGLISAALAIVPLAPSWSLAIFILLAAGVSYLLNRAVTHLQASPAHQQPGQLPAVVPHLRQRQGGEPDHH